MYRSCVHVSPVAPSRYAKSGDRIGSSVSHDPLRNASMNCSLSSVNTLMSSIEPPEIECRQRDHDRVVALDQRHHVVVVVLSPLVASVEGDELFRTLSRRGERADQAVAVFVGDRRAVTDHVDAQAAKHRQRSVAKDAVERLAAARHELVRAHVEHGGFVHAAPRITSASTGSPSRSARYCAVHGPTPSRAVIDATSSSRPTLRSRRTASAATARANEWMAVSCAL